MRLACCVLVLAVLLADCTPVPLPVQAGPITRPVPATVVVDPLWQGTPGAYSMTIRCRAVDATTGQPIRAAHFLVVTVQGSYQFDETCEVSFPVDTVATVSAADSGYEPQTKQLKPHYRRNVVVEVKFQLTPVNPPAPAPGSQAMLGASVRTHIQPEPQDGEGLIMAERLYTETQILLAISDGMRDGMKLWERDGRWRSWLACRPVLMRCLMHRNDTGG
jgi:hypothetical protein